MFGLISRLREPLSEQGRADFAQASILSCIVGVVRGVSLVAFIPAALALTSGNPAWGISLRAWLVVLGVCAVASFIVEYLLAMRSYSVAFDFLSNMHRAIGDKVASLPLGSFRADTAGKTSRLVSRELMVLGEIFAHMYSPLIAAIVTSATMLVGITVFSPVLGLVCVVAIPVIGGGVWVARRCLQSGAAIKEPPARELSHRIVEYATKQGALRACGRSSSYEPLLRAEDAYGVAARRSLMRETVGQIVNGMAAQVVVVTLICAIGWLAVGEHVGPVAAIVAIGLLLRFTQILVDIGTLASAFETRRPVLAQSRDPLRPRAAHAKRRAMRGRGPGLVGRVRCPRGRVLLLRGRPPRPARRFLPRGTRNDDGDRGPLRLRQNHDRAPHRALLRRGRGTCTRRRWRRSGLGYCRPHGTAVPRLPGCLPLRRHPRG